MQKYRMLPLDPSYAGGGLLLPLIEKASPKYKRFAQADKISCDAGLGFLLNCTRVPAK